MSNEVQIRIIDSHTGGEPTRVVIGGAPDLGMGDVASQREIFQRDYDWFRSTVVNEPRGSDVLVGALIVPPKDPSCCAGVIFFNNVGVLGMCGHGAIGLGVTLARMGKISQGKHKIETPVGIIEITYHGEAKVTIQNVPSYRYRKEVNLTLDSGVSLTGDISWGGNWFFLTKAPCEIGLNNLSQLMEYATDIRSGLQKSNVTGEGNQEIDHIELIGNAHDSKNNARNFVLCPGMAYDRSPCGTGTSAKLACLMADGVLKTGQVWRQESVVGSVFEGSAVWDESGTKVIPTITGEAYVTGEGVLILQDADLFRNGLRG